MNQIDFNFVQACDNLLKPLKYYSLKYIITYLLHLNLGHNVVMHFNGNTLKQNQF